MEAKEIYNIISIIKKNSDCLNPVTFWRKLAGAEYITLQV